MKIINISILLCICHTCLSAEPVLPKGINGFNAKDYGWPRTRMIALDVFNPDMLDYLYGSWKAISNEERKRSKIFDYVEFDQKHIATVSSKFSGSYTVTKKLRYRIYYNMRNGNYSVHFALKDSTDQITSEDPILIDDLSIPDSRKASADEAKFIYIRNWIGNEPREAVKFIKNETRQGQAGAGQSTRKRSRVIFDLFSGIS